MVRHAMRQMAADGEHDPRGYAPTSDPHASARRRLKELRRQDQARKAEGSA
jgi:hypothetical protein